jgi:hypothetical protein
MHSRLITVCCVLLSGSLMRPAGAAVPSVVGFQGRLTTPTGAPVADTATQSLTFRLYNAASGGTVLWSQTSSGVTVKGGMFTAPLNLAAGFTTGNTLDSMLSGTAFLEVQAGADAPMTPRLSLASSPYAWRARTAETVPDGSITGAKIAPGTITTANLSVTLTQTLNVLGSFADPRAALCATMPTGGGSYSIAASGSNVYVANYFDSTLQVFDTANPVAPVLRATVTTGNAPSGVAISGGMVYVVNYNSSTLQVFDASNPAALTLKGTASTGNGVSGVAVSGGLACVFNAVSKTLQVFDVSNPSAPTLRGTATAGGAFYSLAMSGNLVAVGTDGGGAVQFFDVSNPASPVLKGAFATGSAQTVALSGNTAYVTTYPNGLQVLDISNPASPVLKGSVATGMYPTGVSASGTTVYVCNYLSNTLQTFDASNPAAPKLVGTGATVPYPWRMAVSGGLAYIASHDTHTLSVYSFNQLQVGANLAVGGAGSFVDGLTVGGGATFGGNVGIGTTTPNFPLSFADTLGDKVSLYGQGSAHAGFGIQPATLQIYTGGAGDSFIFGYGTSAALTETARISNNGDITATGDVYARGVKLTSDGRFKKNVSTLDNALGTVLGLRGVSFDWDRPRWPARNFPDGQQVGFIAQEVEQVLPQVVGTDANGYKSVAYQNVVPVLVEGMKEQQRQIAGLTAENATLKADSVAKDARIADVEARLKRLEEQLDSPAGNGPR